MPVQTHPQETAGAAIESRSTVSGATAGAGEVHMSTAAEVAEARRVADVAAILAAEHEQLLADTTCYRLICPRSSVKQEAEAAASGEASEESKEGAGKSSAAAEGSTELEVEPAACCGSNGMFRFATNFDILLYVLAIIGAVANGAIQPLFAVLFGDLINALTGSGGPSALTDAMNWVALLFVILGVAAFFASFLQKGFTTLAAERQVGKARQAFMAALLRQDVAYFETEQDPAEVATRLTEETMTYSKGIDENIGLIVQHVGATLVGLGVAFYYSWDMALVMFALFPLIVAPTMIMKNGNESEQVLSSRSYARAGSAATESISNIRTVVAFNGQEAEARRYNKQLSIAELVTTRAGRVIGLGMGFLWFMMISCYAVAIVYGATRIRASRSENPLCAVPIQGDPATADCYTAGTLMTALFAVLIGSSSIGMAAPSISAVGKAAGAAAKIFAVIDRVSPINPTSDEGLVPTHKIRGKIEFKSVSFAYPSNKERMVLKDFSVVIEPGQTLALVGESGSGKSTIVQLLMRFYDPDSGTVLLDDKDIREYNVGWLRSQMGLVSQEPSLFATSIEENIALGLPGYESNFGEVTGAEAAAAAAAEGIEVQGGEAVDGLAVLDAATRTAVLEASKAASVHGFAKDLPRGYRTRVGERGGQLSGGQKQRVAIARALIRKPAIFIGDEATSALDSRSEKEVKKAMDKLLRGSKTSDSLTSVLIAHRLSTITNADRILVLGNGSIIEDGTHESLIALKRAYYSLAASQGMTSDSETAATEAAAAEAAAAAAAAAGGVLASAAAIATGGGDASAADLEHQRSRASSTGSAGSREDGATAVDDLTAIRSRIERALGASERLPIDRLFFAIMETATTRAPVVASTTKDPEAAVPAEVTTTIAEAGSEVPLLADEPRVLLLQSCFLEMSISEKRALLAWWAGGPLEAVAEAEGKAASDLAGALSSIKGEVGQFKLLPESTNMVAEAKENKTKIWNARPVVDATQHIMYVPPCRSRNDMLGSLLTASAPPVPFSRLWAYQSGDICALAVAAIASIFNGLLMPAYALGLSDMITELSKVGDEFEAAVLTYTLFFVILGAVAFLAEGVGTTSFVILGAKLTTRLRKDTYTALMRQEVGYFDYPFRSTGQLTGRLSTDASLVKAMVGERLGVVIASVISLIGGLVIAFEATWQLSLIVMALVPALGFANYIEMQVVTGFSTASKDALEGSARIASEAMLGIRTVTGLGMQKHIVMSFSRSLEGPRRNAVRAGMVGGATMGLSQFINYGFAFAIVFWVGGLFVADGTIQPGAVFRSFFGLSFGVAGAAQASALSGDIGKAQSATRSIFALIDRIPKIATTSFSSTSSSSAITVATSASGTAREVTATAGPARHDGGSAFRPRIEFKNVTFSYPARPEAVALKNFSAVFEAGTTVGLVGPSGSGKSTIVQLLMRFYDPDEGVILINDRDIREYDVAWLRDRMGLVGQEPVLFSDSIYYNIAYGREGDISNKPLPDLGLATDSSVPAEAMTAVEAAATSAFAHDFISKKLPLGYTTFAGVQGSSRLSGGQKQRVAIARALIRDPAIFVGDEATSALDSQSEKEVQRALDAMLEETRAKALNRTSVFVAHRLSTIRASDAICVLRDGGLVELGTHDELLSKGGLYKTLAEAQHMLSSSSELEAAKAAGAGAAAAVAGAKAPDAAVSAGEAGVGAGLVL